MQEKRPAGREARQRLITALIVGPVALASIWAGRPYFDAVVAGVLVLAAREWVRLAGIGLSEGAPGVFLSALVVPLAWAVGPLAALLVLIAGVLALAASSGRVSRLWSGAGLAYLGVVGLALVGIRADVEGGRNLTLWLVVVVWASDSGAYALGRMIGGPRLAPRLSAGKTWAGVLGGFVAALAVGIALAAGLFAGDPRRAALAAVLIAVAAQSGDLLESGVKRHFGAKDSGGLMPGHGGVLDRVDSLVAAAPALAAYIVLGPALGLPVFWR